MSSLSFNRSKNKQNNNNPLRNIAKKPTKKQGAAKKGAAIQNDLSQNSQIISGYFVKEKSYKEMKIARVNNFLCSILVFLLLVCFVSYYFVTMSEVSLNKIRKETLAINYENEELQIKIDSLQSYNNVDKAVARTNMLQRATNVVELSAKKLPSVSFSHQKNQSRNPWSMGY